MENNLNVSMLLLIGVFLATATVTVDPHKCGDVCCTSYKPHRERCIECPPGWYGANCSEICADGLYGRLCKEQCPSQCNTTCDKISGRCQGLNTDLEDQIIKFVERNIWLLIGTSSIFVLCSCVWAVIFYKICTKDKRQVIDHSADQNPQQSNGIIYENDEASIQHSTSVQPPPLVFENNISVPQEQVQYSKVKKRNSQTRKNVVSKEMTSHEDYNDDSDDMFDSDEFEDSNEICSKVQISDLPKTSQPEQQSMRRPNEAYGSIWL
eukprot:XP_011446289.1 PREDICTED: uncharacterized protein LOC105341442 [Crassostrea gigas]